MVDEETDNQKVQVNLLAQLREGSEYLENQKEALSHLWEGFRGKVVTFYETKQTKSVKKVRRTTTTALYYPNFERALCFVSSLLEERTVGYSGLTEIARAGTIRTGRTRKRSPNGAAVVCSALFA